MSHPNTSGLRTFLWRIGGDVDSGREAFRSLCLLHLLVTEFRRAPEKINEAINLLESQLGGVQARAAKGLVATEALAQPEQLESLAFDFVVRNLEFVNRDQLLKQSDALGREIWRRDINRFVKFQNGTELQRYVANSGLALLTLEELLIGLRSKPELSSVIFKVRPDLLTLPEFWLASREFPDSVLPVFADTGERRVDMLAAMIAADRGDLADQVISKLGGIDILRIISALLREKRVKRSSLKRWLVAAAQPETVAQFLVENRGLSHEILSEIARVSQPDSVPNDFGIDPWLIAIRATTQTAKDEGDDFLSAFLFARALGRRSRNSGELAVSTSRTYMKELVKEFFQVTLGERLKIDCHGRISG